ncbi:hypothetical protein ACSFB8_02500 [Enterococcus faecalis]
MKKIIWIHSVNANGSVLASYPAIIGGRPSKQMQKELTAALFPEWKITFISYDVKAKICPQADVLVYNQVDAAYLNHYIKQNALAIPYQALQTKAMEEIKDAIEQFAKKNLQKK